MPVMVDFLNAGVTVRQVEYWTRQGYLKPEQMHPGSGYARTWSDQELLVAVRMARLVAAGLTVQAAHRVARGQTELAPGVRIVISETP